MKKSWAIIYGLLAVCLLANTAAGKRWVPKIASGGGGGSLAVVNVWKASGTPGASVVTVSPSAGNLLVVGLATQGDGSTAAHTVVDNQLSTWVKIPFDQIDASSDGISFWYLKNCGSGITTITATDSTNYTTAVVYEISGASVTAPFTTGEFVSGANNVATTNPQTGALTNATANSIYIAGVGVSGAVNPETFTLNAAGSTGTWVNFNSNCFELDGTTKQVCSFPSQIVSSSSARGCGWTTNSWIAVKAIVCFHN